MIEHALQDGVRDFLAALDGMIPIHQHLGLDDRDDARFLAKRRIARQAFGIGIDRVGRGDAGTDVDHRAPLGEARPELVVPGQPFAQTVQALGDGLAAKPASGFAPMSTLMPGIMLCWLR